MRNQAPTTSRSCMYSSGLCADHCEERLMQKGKRKGEEACEVNIYIYIYMFPSLGVVLITEQNEFSPWRFGANNRVFSLLRSSMTNIQRGSSNKLQYRRRFTRREAIVGGCGEDSYQDVNCDSSEKNFTK